MFESISALPAFLRRATNGWPDQQPGFFDVEGIGASPDEEEHSLAGLRLCVGHDLVSDLVEVVELLSGLVQELSPFVLVDL